MTGSESQYPLTTEVVRDGNDNIVSEKISIGVPSGAPSVQLLKMMSEYDHSITPSSGGVIQGQLRGGYEDKVSPVDPRRLNNPALSFRLLPQPHNGKGGEISIEGTPQMLNRENVHEFADALHTMLGISPIRRNTAEGWVHQLQRTEKAHGKPDGKGHMVSRISTVHGGR